MISQFLTSVRSIACGLVLCSAGASLWAQANPADMFPSRPIRIVVGYPAGQTLDVTARAYGAALQRTLGKSVFIDNKPGANGIIAAQIVKDAPADGHTLLFGGAGQLAINYAIYAKLPYKPTDFSAVAVGALGQLYLVANKELPVNDLPSLLAYTKAHPGKVSYGSGGNGITGHLGMELVKAATGMEMLHVPYKGSPGALNGLLGNEVQVMFDAGSLITPQLAAGNVKLLGVSGKKRYEAAPRLGTLAEQGLPGFEVVTLSALVAPAGTPAPIIEKLNAAMRDAGQTALVANAIRAGGSEPQQHSVEESQRFLRAQVVLWDSAAKRARITLD